MYKQLIYLLVVTMLAIGCGRNNEIETQSTSLSNNELVSEDTEELCLATEGKWEPTSCGHYVCGEQPLCRALIPGCNCGYRKNFQEGVGCVEDDECKECLTDADCESGRCITTEMMCLYGEACREVPVYRCADVPRVCPRDTTTCPDGTTISRTIVDGECVFDCSAHQLPEGACLLNRDCQSDVCVFDYRYFDGQYGYCAEDEALVLCQDTCEWANDGECDDGGQGSAYNVCGYGSDCGDCGTRT